MEQLSNIYSNFSGLFIFLACLALGIIHHLSTLSPNTEKPQKKEGIRETTGYKKSMVFLLWFLCLGGAIFLIAGQTWLLVSLNYPTLAISSYSISLSLFLLWIALAITFSFEVEGLIKKPESKAVAIETVKKASVFGYLYAIYSLSHGLAEPLLSKGIEEAMNIEKNDLLLNIFFYCFWASLIGFLAYRMRIGGLISPFILLAMFLSDTALGLYDKTLGMAGNEIWLAWLKELSSGYTAFFYLLNIIMLTGFIGGIRASFILKTYKQANIKT